jgi:hypothetical protein
VGKEAAVQWWKPRTGKMDSFKNRKWPQKKKKIFFGILPKIEKWWKCLK